MPAGDPQSDPVTKCDMPGIRRATYPFEILPGDGDMLFSYAFANANRDIHMDKADQLAADDMPVDQWME